MEVFSEELDNLKSNEFYIVEPLDKAENRAFVKHMNFTCHSLTYYTSKNMMLNYSYIQVREYTAPIHIVLKKAKREIFLFRLLRNSPNFVKCLGFNVKIIKDNTATYTLFTRLYQKSLIDAFRDPDFDKLRAINLMHSSLLELHSKGLYYGALEPHDIFIDENNEIVLNNLFLADYWKQPKIFDLESSGFFLFNENLIAPEISIIIKSMINPMLMKTNLKCLDVFSFGATLFYLFTGVRIDFDFFKENFDPCAQLDSIVNLKVSKIKTSLETHEDWKKYLLQYINDLTPSLSLIVNECLKLRRQERISIQALGGAVKMFSNIEIHTAISKMKSKQILSQVCNNIIEIDRCHEENSNVKQLMDNAVLMANTLLTTYKVELDEAYKSFLGSPCNEIQNYNLSSAILYLIQSLCKEIIRGVCRENIAIKIICQAYNKNYFDILMNLYNKEVIAQDYIITGLTLINLDWEDAAYFFVKELVSRRESRPYFKFSDFSIIKNSFMKIALHPQIIKIFSEFNSNIDANNAISQIIERAYYYRIQPSLYGVMTYNGNIFISLFSALEPGSLNLHDMASSFIVLLHEIAHALRRFNCKSFQEAKNIWTPPKSQLILQREEQGLTEYELMTLKGEAGFMFEEKLFGKLLKFLNVEAAEYFMTADFDDLQKFQVRINKLNTKRILGQYTSLGRQKFYRLSEKTCGLSNISMFEVESDEEN